jgi:hypothetical protein
MYKVIRKIFALEIVAQRRNISANVLLSRAVYQETYSAIKSSVRARHHSPTGQDEVHGISTSFCLFRSSVRMER